MQEKKEDKEISFFYNDLILCDIKKHCCRDITPSILLFTGIIKILSWPCHMPLAHLIYFLLPLLAFPFQLYQGHTASSWTSWAWKNIIIYEKKNKNTCSNYIIWKNKFRKYLFNTSDESLFKLKTSFSDNTSWQWSPHSLVPQVPSNLPSHLSVHFFCL